MALKEAETLVVHHYPSHILDSNFADRRIEIRVIANETLDGVGDEFRKRLDKKVDDFEKIEKEDWNFWKTASVQPADINSSKIIENTKKIQNGSIIYSIVLPLPNSLLDRAFNQWEEKESIISKGLKGAASFASSSLASGLNKLSATGTDIATKSTSLTGKITGNLTKVTGKAAEALTKAITTNAGDIIAEAGASMGFRQPTIDPGWFQEYIGTRPRTFEMDFDFLPNNDEEATMIQNIILNLKKFSTPRSTITGVSLLSPYTFEILFGNEKIQKLINMSNVVLKTIDVNYSGDGNMLMFADGSPTYIKLNLGFAEMNVVTAELYHGG